MHKIKILLLTALCASILFCGCGKQDNNAGQMSEEESAKIVELLESAERTYSNGSKLDIYYEVLALDPGNVSARLGMAQCYIMQEEYELASESLLLTAKLDPSNSEVYDMFEKLCKASDDRAYGDIALALARQNNQTSFLELIPSEPVFSLESGAYTEKVNIEVSSVEAGADVYISVANDAENGYNIKESKYFTPITLLRGTNVVSAYVVKNGIPSETVTMEYVVDYEPVEVKFQESAIEKLVRIALDKPTGPITDADCEGIKELSWPKLKSTVNGDEAYKKIQIKTLEDLQYFPRLTTLVLEYQNKLTDFSPLQYCPCITALRFDHCQLTSANFVRYTPNVQQLLLCNFESEGVRLYDIDALEELKNLRNLDLRGKDLCGYISDTSWRVESIDKIIENNPNLQYLNFNAEHLSNWQLLLDLENLVHINVWGIQETNYSVLSKLENLDSLYVYFGYYEWHMTARSLSYLQDLNNLTKFGMQGLDDASQLKYLKGLENLESLILANSDVVQDEQAMKELEAALPGCKIESSY